MFPPFYNDVKQISLIDPLANILGASQGGVLHYTYSDVVKMAGHSCPTVAGAYMMVVKGLHTLYQGEKPVRGEIDVVIKGVIGEGVVGVIASVATLITGATSIQGFHGLGGQFDRRNLLRFDPTLQADMILSRRDNKDSVMISYDPSLLPFDRMISTLLPHVITSRATEEDLQSFQLLWQQRVENLLLHYWDHPHIVTVTSKTR